MLMDFEDSVLHDQAWKPLQPVVNTGFYVRAMNQQEAKAGGPIAAGEGRGGSNAQLIKSMDVDAVLPGGLSEHKLKTVKQRELLTNTAIYFLAI